MDFPRIATSVPDDQALRSAIECFCANLVGTRQRSPKTEMAYRYDLQQLGTVIGFDTPVAALDRSHIEEWLAYLRHRQYKPASVRRKIACVRGFLRQQRRHGVLVIHPFEGVEICVRPEQRLTRTLLDREFELLLATADRQTESRAGGPRDLLLLAVR